MFGIGKTLCFRGDMDVYRPLRRGIYIKVANKQVWIRFKYVKLSNFCYGCGRLGYVLASCDLVQTTEDDTNLQYGVWLGASSLKSHRRNA